MKLLIIIPLFFGSLLLKAQEYKISFGFGVPILLSNSEFANQNSGLFNTQTNLSFEYNNIYLGMSYGSTLFTSDSPQNVKTIINRPAFEGGGIINFGKNQIRPAIQLGYSFIRVKDNLFGKQLVAEEGVFFAPKLSLNRDVSDRFSIAAYSIFNIDFTDMPYLAFDPIKQKSYTMMYLFGISVGYRIK